MNCPSTGWKTRGAPTTRSFSSLLRTVAAWEITMNEEFHTVGFPELMTETELMHFLRIPDVSQGADPHHVVENLKRFHRLPCIHISKKPLYPLVAVRRWVEEKLVKERSA
jgi:hypothetical protein